MGKRADFREYLANISEAERCIVAMHTLFSIVKEAETRKARAALNTLLGAPYTDYADTLKELEEDGLLRPTGYDWRSGSNFFELRPQLFAPVMVLLYEEYPELAKRTLNACKGMPRRKAQEVLWLYITSGYRNVSDTVAEIDGDSEATVAVFAACTGTDRFIQLLLALSPGIFFNVIDEAISVAISDDTLDGVDNIRRLLAEYGKCTVPRETAILANERCHFDYLRYLATGERPPQLLAANAWHMLIAAIHKTYAADYAEAVTHFKTAVGLHNKFAFDHYRLRLTLPYFPDAFANYAFVTACLARGTDEAQRRAATVVKDRCCAHTLAARCAYRILRDTGDEENYAADFKGLEGSSEFEAQLARLMKHYLEQPDKYRKSPDLNMLILKQELRKYVTLSEVTVRRLDEAYGTEGLLARFRRRPKWESVLDELMGKSDGVVTERASKRVAYMMNDINDDTVEVRQQSVLKSGKWSAGKAVALYNLLVHDIEGMNEADKKIAMRHEQRIKGRSLPSPPDCLTLADILPEMTDGSRLQVGACAPYTTVEVQRDMPYITLKRTPDGFEVESNVSRDCADSDVVITHRGAASINFVQLTPEQQIYYGRLLALGRFPLEAEEQLREFLKGVGGKMEVNSDLIEGGSTIPAADGNPRLTMQMRPQDKETYVVNLFVRPLDGGRTRCVPGKGDETVIDARETESGETVACRTLRRLDAEADNMRHFIGETGFKEFGEGNSTVVIDAYDLLPLIEYAQGNPDRITCEWPEGAQMRVKRRSPSAATWSGAISKTENGWFTIEGNVEVDDGKVITMAQLLELASQSRGRFIKLGEGDFLALSDKLRKQLDALSAIASHARGVLQISPFAAALLGADILDGEMKLSEDDELKQIRQRIKDASEYSPEVPTELNATLRNYQLDGYRWMARLNKWGAGALLADDMGLGKTIQTIALLLKNAVEGPALVVAPASVAPNWITELRRFAPTLNAAMLNYAEDRTKLIGDAKAGDVVVTTYGLLISVESDVTGKHWTTVCLDEAHIVKNRGAKTSAVAMKLKSDNRVMLTGTPVQNHLGELWNLFQFVNPGLLGSFKDFNSRFIIPIEQNGDRERQRRLDRIVKPFMLRRTKDKVAGELPEKEEIYQRVAQSEAETLVYEAIRRRAEAMLLADGLGNVSMNTLAEITRLRQCACDTRLVDDSGTDGAGTKITALVELLQTILDGGGRALVFSQFTSYLALVQTALTENSIPYLYMDGSVSIKARQKLVRRYQSGECPVFLISLKAGGLGLNLTEANYVIHLDPWWNPATEAQATDRAHRIGQRNAVTVYHFIAAGTIEEKIQRMHERKQALVRNVLESTDISHKLTGEELLEMVRG